MLPALTILILCALKPQKSQPGLNERHKRLREAALDEDTVLADSRSVMQGALQATLLRRDRQRQRVDGRVRRVEGVLGTRADPLRGRGEWCGGVQYRRGRVAVGGCSQASSNVVRVAVEGAF